jgi:lipoyl(octanoyl) transferase
VSERVIHLVRLCEAPGPLLWPYERAQALQQRLVARRQEGCVGDVLLLLEHAPVITLGLRADEGHILATAEALAEAGVAVARSERGGDVTYHGPGQLVGYPILHLASYDLGASDYMHRLEVVLMRALADFGIITHRREGIIGVWVGANKIAALGVRIKRGVTFHGFALNVAPQMAHFDLIIPCGITDGGVTSMAQELAHPPDMAEVEERVAHHFGALFGVKMVPTVLEALCPDPLPA